VNAVLGPRQLLLERQTTTNQLAIVAEFPGRRPNRGKRVAGENVPAQDLLDANHVALVGLVGARLDRVRQMRRRQNENTKPRLLKKVGKHEAAARGLVSKPNLVATYCACKRFKRLTKD